MKRMIIIQLMILTGFSCQVVFAQDADQNYNSDQWSGGDADYDIINVDGMEYQFNDYHTAVQPTRSNRGRPRRVIPEYIIYEGKEYPVYLNYPLFEGDNELEEVELYCKMKDMYRTFYLCSKLKSVILPDCVQSLGMFTFHGCKFTNIRLPKGLKTIGSNAFEYCNSLETVIVNDSLEIMEFCAFRECNDLKEFRFPASVKDIHDPFAMSDSHLQSIVFEDGEGDLRSLCTVPLPHLTYLYCGRRSMNPGWEMPNLKELVIGAPVQVLELPGLKVSEAEGFKVYAKSEAPSNISLHLGASAENIYTQSTLYVPIGTRELYKATDGWNRFLNIVEYDATSIPSVRSTSDSKAIYNISGRVNAKTSKGIYIKGGKKYLMK